MQNSQSLPGWLRIFRNAILFDILIYVTVAIICLLAGWRTIHQYGNTLIWAGGIGIILLMAIGPNWRNSRWDEWAALSKMIREHELFFQFNRERDTRARFMLIGLITLAITLATGIALTSLF